MIFFIHVTSLEKQIKIYGTVKTSLTLTLLSTTMHIIFECAKFNRRMQQEDESVDDFMIDLNRYCNYGCHMIKN